MWGPPHLSWLVVALLVQRERQRWHHAVAHAALHGGDDVGDLPGHHGWTYRRHGLGLCLRGPDGEVLDADFLTETGEVIDAWFFANISPIGGHSNRLRLGRGASTRKGGR